MAGSIKYAHRKYGVTKSIEQNDKTRWQTLKIWAGKLKTEAYALYLAYRDPRTPWYARVLAFFVVAHTFSPIDLVPDFIPVLGYFDDLIITTGGLWLALRLIPPEVIAEARSKAADCPERVEKLGRVGFWMVITIWMVVAAMLIALAFRAAAKRMTYPAEPVILTLMTVAEGMLHSKLAGSKWSAMSDHFPACRRDRSTWKHIASI